MFLVNFVRGRVFADLSLRWVRNSIFRREWCLVAFPIAFTFWKKAESTTEPITVDFRTLRNKLRIFYILICFIKERMTLVGQRVFLLM